MSLKKLTLKVHWSDDLLDHLGYTYAAIEAYYAFLMSWSGSVRTGLKVKEANLLRWGVGYFGIAELFVPPLKMEGDLMCYFHGGMSSGLDGV